MKFSFGDLIENGYASADNPRRIGIYVRTDSKGHFDVTDGKGTFWKSARDNEKIVKIGTVLAEKKEVTE